MSLCPEIYSGYLYSLLLLRLVLGMIRKLPHLKDKTCLTQVFLLQSQHPQPR
jgi:hypothetical protein